VPSAADGRDAGGRFTRGNRGGLGNPLLWAVGARRQALLDAVSPEDVAAVGRKLGDQALAGDTAAPKVLFAHVVGRLRCPPPTAPTSTSCGC
jgi:hypothetical protein